MSRCKVLAVMIIVLGAAAPSVHGSTRIGFSSVTISTLSLFLFPGEACGGPLDNVCAVGEFCQFPTGLCDSSSISGVCTETGGSCITVWIPVCGCDGNTYGNDCEAAAAGVNIAYDGECSSVCGGIAGIPCPNGEFCKLNMGECCCDFQGTCTPLPQVCIDVWDPVCGCDGLTYGNDCEADAAGVSIDRVGTCDTNCTDAANLPCVTVVVDMDANTPGIQRNVVVPVGTTVVRDVAVYVFDSSASHSIWGIGYLGGIDRGIGLGHASANAGAIGQVVSLDARTIAPANPNATSWLLALPALDRAFSGVEVQYLESSTQPAPLPTAPTMPIFTADIHLENIAAGDVYNFYLVDYVTIWSGGSGGAFSTQGINTLDTGGDAVPDGTTTMTGIDLDAVTSLPSPAFAVDYIDGGNDGPATITVSDQVLPNAAIPATSTWGVICMALFMLTVGTLVLQKKILLTPYD